MPATRLVRIGLAAATIAAVVVAISACSGTSDPGASPTAAASAPGRTTNPPWDAPADPAKAVAAAGLTMLGEEGSAQHIHAHLDVLANGQPVPVPADIGVDEAHLRISPLHSHEANGVIHIESPSATEKFTLGQFFAEWQVSLSDRNIGGLRADDTHQLKVYVNGQVRTGDPNGIVLAPHDEIAIVYGTDAQQASPPRSYAWPAGL